MKNFKVVVLFILILTTLNSCGTVKEAFSTQKKNSTDEFLVEKKNPLKLPPDFDELPTPNHDLVLVIHQNQVVILKDFFFLLEIHRCYFFFVLKKLL